MEDGALAPAYTGWFQFRNQHLGTTKRSTEIIHGAVMAPRSLAFFCPECGEIWARHYVEGQFWQTMALACDKHPPRHPAWVTGSMWIDWDKAYQLSMPMACLLREFWWHLNWWEHFNRAEQKAA
jgi:hypothetical protein